MLQKKTFIEQVWYHGSPLLKPDTGKHMLYRVMADAVVGLHLSFVLFVVCGGFLTWRWPRLAYLHIPAFLWGAGIEIAGWICPLTYLENDLRDRSAAAGYSNSFVEHYIVPLLYPEQLFQGQFPRSGFLWIGAFILILNGLIYWRLWVKRQTRQNNS